MFTPPYLDHSTAAADTFDPHEPFFSNQNYKDLYPHDYKGPEFYWPKYKRVTEPRDQVEHVRYEYAALLSMCDAYMGKVLDTFDRLDLWKDTMLIVNTDHGFLLGEHDWWAKVVMPWYNELANTPLFIWDPRSGCANETRGSLVQTIDLAPTVMEFFGVDRPKDMLGVPLRETIASDAGVREAALYGLHGAHVNCTDGRYVYIANPDNAPLFNYTLMPTHMRGPFRPEELKNATLAEPFTFTKECPTLKIPARVWTQQHEFSTMLFDLESDPGQLHPIDNHEVEDRMIRHMIRVMKENDAPPEQYERLGL